MYGHVITKFSGMGRFTKLWGSAHTRARGAPLLLSSLAKENETCCINCAQLQEIRYIKKTKHQIQSLLRLTIGDAVPESYQVTRE